MRIDSSGNVGIGTSSPSAKLHLKQSDGTPSTGLKIVRHNNDNQYLSLWANGGARYFDAVGDSSVSSVNIFRSSIDSGSNFTETMRIDSSGNVGIGTSSPSGILDLDTGASHGNVYFRTSTVAGYDTKMHFIGGASNSENYLYFGYNGDEDNSYIRRDGSSNLSFGVNNSERMRIDSSGHLMVGTTAQEPSVSNDDSGFSVRPVGTASISRTSGPSLDLNRKSSDGDIAVFRKDGSTVGSIGTNSSRPYFEKSAAGGISISSSGGNPILLPTSGSGALSNGLANIGAASYRFKDAYLSGGVYLGGTGSANKLDDYEEGTWTPLFGDNSTTASSGGQSSATYVKIGKLVTVSADITTLTYSGANLNHMYGLPFVGGVTGVGNGGGGVGFTTSVNIVPGLHVTSNTSAIYFINLGTNVSGEALSISGKRFIFSLTYETS